MKLCALLAAVALTLVWDYPHPSTDIVFNVWSRTNLFTGKWECIGTVTNKSFEFTPDSPVRFFTVTASNVVTGLESGFSRN